MVLTLEIAPEKEAILRQKAAMRGQSLNDYVAGIVEQAVNTYQQPIKPRHRVAAVRAIGAYATRADAGLPPLSNEDMSRESIYGARDL